MQLERAQTPPASSTSLPARSSSRGPSLRDAVRGTDGYAAQSALLAPQPVQRRARGGPASASPAAQPAGQSDIMSGAEDPQMSLEDPARLTDASPQAQEAAPPQPEPPPIPEAAFEQEGVLKAWIRLFNASLLGQAKKTYGTKKRATTTKKHDKIQSIIAKGWGTDTGLDFDLLKAKAAEDSKVPLDSVTAAHVLKMLSKNGGAVFNDVIKKDYVGQCLQFSQTMMDEMGAKRADGTKSDSSKGDRKPDALTAAYRGKNIWELPIGLPPGCQIAVTSRPDWGFTEVGNHWFMSGGGGIFLDNTGGVFTGQKLSDWLCGTMATQWADRLTGPKNAKELKLAKQFVEAEQGPLGPDVEVVKKLCGLSELKRAQADVAKVDKDLGKLSNNSKYDKKRTRLTEQQTSLNGKIRDLDTQDLAVSEAERTRVFSKVKDHAGNTRKELYRPKIWLVEPTSKSTP
jgi:hypothetical protein